MVGPQARFARILTLGLRALLVMLWGTSLATPAGAARLCMLPPAVPFAEDDERRGQLERIVTRHFEAESIGIAPSAQVEPLLKAVDERSGAIFDPLTGRVDAARYALYEEDVERSLRDELGCTGMLRLGLHQVPAWYDGTNATWDGQSAKVNSTARIATRVAVSILAGAYITETGWVPALSLWIQVMDLRHHDIAFRSAGVEPLMDFSYSRDQDLLPEDRWLRDDAIVEGAVTSALGADLSALKADVLPADRPGVADFRWE